MGLTPGTRIGSYEIASPIGAGGMGEVYRARDRKLERDVAIKALPSTVGDDSALLTRLQHEARMLAALNHPNIAVIHDLEEWAGGSFLVLELVEGDTLDVRLQRTGPLPVIEALTIGVQVAAALQAAHARGITHRDIKPANIKLTPNNTIKVLDFGLAKPNAAPAGQDAELVTRSVTGVGVLLGTPPYMSPEQVLTGKHVDHRSDLWSLAVVVYHAMIGDIPFQGETFGALCVSIDRCASCFPRRPSRSEDTRSSASPALGGPSTSPSSKTQSRQDARGISRSTRRKECRKLALSS